MTAVLSRPFGVRRLHKPQFVVVEASDGERAKIAAAYGLLGVDRLVAKLSLRPWNGDGVEVSGTVDGVVSQACVVSLEPVMTAFEEPLERRFSPDAAGRAMAVDVDPDAPDPPERLERDSVDLGAIALEHFLIGLPDYPRAPGVEFEPQERVDEEPSPFAVLASLRNNSN